MKNIFYTLWLALGFAAVTADAGMPTLEAGTEMEYQGYPIWVSTWSLPTVADWNSDGIKDLLVGSDEGKVRLYLGATAGPNPWLASMQYLQVDGGDFVLPGG